MSNPRPWEVAGTRHYSDEERAALAGLEDILVPLDPNKPEASWAGIVTSAPAVTETPPVTFGQMWDAMVNLMTEHEYRPLPGLIVGPAKWHRIMVNATPEERVILEGMVDSGQIILSHHLPDPEVAYRFSPAPWPIRP